MQRRFCRIANLSVESCSAPRLDHEQPLYFGEVRRASQTGKKIRVVRCAELWEELISCASFLAFHVAHYRQSLFANFFFYSRDGLHVKRGTANSLCLGSLLKKNLSSWANFLQIIFFSVLNLVRKWSTKAQCKMYNWGKRCSFEALFRGR